MVRSIIEKMIGCDGDRVMDKWLENIHFYETMVLKKARSCQKIKKEDIFSMIRWAVYADKSWMHDRLRDHMNLVLQEPRAKIRPSRRLVMAFINNMLIEERELKDVISTIARQIPETQMTNYEYFHVLYQRRELRSNFERFVGPLSYDKDLCGFLRRLLLSERINISVNDINFRDLLFKLAIEEDVEKNGGDFKVTKWLSVLFLPSLKCDREKEALLELVRNELAVHNVSNKR